MIVATLWGYFFLPETKGLTMDQMDVILYVALVWTQHFSETMLTFLVNSGYAHDARPEPSTKFVDATFDDNKAKSSEHTEAV